MDNVLGIIAEYNPFHNGHLYHLIKSKEAAQADYTIAIISGNFTQRGEVSVVSKWDKAEMALSCGIDLVIELPTLYAISSAENFASGAINILNSLKIVDYIAFGAETTDINSLDRVAEVLANEPREFKSILQHELSKGISYPKARENALLMYLNDIRRFANILSTPNNILGIEYLKALRKSKSSISPICIPRIGGGHNDLTISKNLASGTAIRNLINLGEQDSLKFKRLMPVSSYSILKDCIKKGHYVPGLQCYEKEILFTLRQMSIEDIANLPDVSEGMEHMIKRAGDSCNSLVEFMDIVNTKRYTATRIQRILLYALLGITKEDMKISKSVTPYIRVLGFNSNGKKLISKMSEENPKLNIITSVRKFLDTNKNKNYDMMINTDIWATDVYSLGFEYDSRSNLDFTKKIITFD